MAVSMEDLISTMKNSAHVGQGSDLRELQAQLNQALPNVPISRTNQSSSNPFDCPPPPASSWNDQPTSNAFLSSSPFTARLMAHAAASQSNQSNGQQYQSNQNNQRNLSSIPAPNSGSQFQQQSQIQNQAHGQGQNKGGQQESRENRRETRSYTKAMSPSYETDNFANDAFRPLYEKAEAKQKGFKSQK